ncbi:DNA-binding protein [Pseudomonas nitroreducens]|uniref:DNA-binding protein n=1 Tax=Pseudomonas nitroreducens TaxID=46680 RepID=UPI003FA7ACD0
MKAPIRDFHSAKELAGLPGMPQTVSGVIRQSKRESWACQLRIGRGGGQEFHIKSLPDETRQALMQAAIASISEAPAQLPPVGKALPVQQAAAEALTHRQTLTRDARMIVVRALRQLAGARELSEKAACILLLAQAERGELTEETLASLALGNNKSGLAWGIKAGAEGLIAAELAPGQDVRRAACTTSVRTLERWLAVSRDGGADALAPSKRERDMSVPAWAPYLLRLMQRPQKPFLSDAWRGMCRDLPRGIPAPSYDAAYRWYSKKYSNLDKQRGRNQGSALNPHKHHITRTSRGMVPMQEIHSDGWGTHFTAPHPISGKYVKLECWHTHDVATRYVFRPSVGLSESMLVILGSLYNAVAEGGRPAVWQTDNTGSVKNDRVSFDPVTSIQARLGVTIVHNLPGNSQANGICESFNKYLDRRARDLATYMGKGMDSLAQKRVLRITQKLVKAEELQERRRLKDEAERVGSGHLVGSFAEAQALLEQWCDDFNNTPHSALPWTLDAEGKRRRQTPAEAWAEHLASGWQPFTVEGEQLQDLFRPHETKVVRRAKVRLYSQDYHHAELEHWNGEDVQVAYDIHDGERVWVKTLEGRLICEASLDKVRGYRARSVYEMALEKRADAAIARHETHIAEIERQRPIHVITQDAALNIPGLGDLTAERLASRFDTALVIDVEPQRLPAKGEGGLDGTLDLMFGEEDQELGSIPAKLRAMLGGLVPAFRGISTGFYSGLITAMNPYQGEVTIELWSERGDLQSLQRHSWSLEYTKHEEPTI